MLPTIDGNIAPKLFMAGCVVIKMEVLGLLKIKVGGAERTSLMKRKKLTLNVLFLIFRSNIKEGELPVVMLKQ